MFKQEMKWKGNARGGHRTMDTYIMEKFCDQGWQQSGGLK